MKILLNLRNCWHRKDRENSWYGRLWVRDERCILLVTYKYLKTCGRVRRNRVFSQPYFVAPWGKAASHICKNTSSGSFLLPPSSFLLPPASCLTTPISSLLAFIEMLPGAKVKNPVYSPRTASRCVYVLKLFEDGRKMSRNLRYPPGIFKAKVK